MEEKDKDAAGWESKQTNRVLGSHQPRGGFCHEVTSVLHAFARFLHARTDCQAAPRANRQPAEVTEVFFKYILDDLWGYGLWGGTDKGIYSVGPSFFTSVTSAGWQSALVKAPRAI
jgi:hypothetical protein